MILTEDEKKAIISNLQLDVGDWNHNGLSVVNAIEAALLAKLADKLLDADRLSYHLQGNPMTVKMRKITVIHGPNKESEYPSAWRCAIDAAILAEKQVNP